LEEALAEYCGAKYVVGCASGSDALLLALAALGVGAGDEVILPSFTFFATAGAVWRVGARPVFADIEPDSFNLDPRSVAECITPATRAILPVHLFGQCADMAALTAIAREHGLHLIEDVAQAIGAELGGTRAGSFGQIGCFSFYPTKNLGGCGDGGMMTTDDEALAARLRILRDHGQHPQYHHRLVGFNSRLDSLQAAALLVRLPHLETWAGQRTENARRYAEGFRAAGLAETFSLPREAPGGRHVWNQYTIRAPGGYRDALKAAVAAAGVGTAVYYPIPLHLQECFAELGYRPGRLPETERAAREVLSLPIFPGLTEAESELVVRTIAQQWRACTRRAAA
jgi:dTDP-4-amino-4,6-dideoxygalactose transaminase